MRRRNALLLAALLGFHPKVHAVNLHGKVSNKQGKAVANAIVTLTPQGLADTTGADGAYSITGATSIAPAVFAGRAGASLKSGILQIVLEEPAPLSVEVFDSRGARLNAERFPSAPAGVYRWDVGKSAAGSRVLWIKAAIGKETTTFRHARLADGEGGENASFENAAPAAGRLAKAAADPDSLKVTAPG